MRNRSKPLIVLACGLSAALVAGCEKPNFKSQPDPTAKNTTPAVSSAPVDTTPAIAPMSDGLAKRSEFPSFYLDHIGEVLDPINHAPVVVPAGQPLVLDGFAFDAVANKPAKGVDLVVDGKAHGSTYGSSRPDVAQAKGAALLRVGYTATVPGGAVAAGFHQVVVRVIAADGAGYFESPPFTFEAR